MANYRLVNAEERARENPGDFTIPPEKTRRNLRTPDLVKLIFEPLDGGHAQRMWVLVAGPSATEGRFVGTVYNRPLGSSLPRFGTVIEFGPEHVIDWQGPLGTPN